MPLNSSRLSSASGSSSKSSAAMALAISALKSSMPFAVDLPVSHRVARERAVP